VDKAAHTGLVKATYGVTVGVLHTGRHYPEDLAPDGIVYHYPVTRQAGEPRHRRDWSN